MNDIQKPIFGCVLPANDLSAENMRYMASSVDTLELELEFASCMEDGDALHSVFAESSMSSQGSDPFAEEATNTPVFPQERSDLFSEVFKILATSEYDDLAKQATNIYAFSQKRPAESSMSSQGFDPLVRKKIKRTNAESSLAVAGTSSQGSGFAASSTLKLLSSKISPPKDADSSEAQQAHSKRACMRLNRRKLNINGRIISLGPKESVFVKLLFEKINTHVPIDDLYVAVYGGEAGDWKKDSRKEKKCFYSLLDSLRKKLPKSCFKGKASKGYMLSGSVMTSQDSDPFAEEAANFQSTSAVARTSSQGFPSKREEIKRTPAQNEMVYSSGIGINIENKELEIDGESFIFGHKTFVFVKLLFERMNTYVSLDDLYVAAYGEDKALPTDFMQKRCLYRLVSTLYNLLPEDYIRGTSKMGYMLSNSNELVDVSYQGFEASPKKSKGTDDSDSSEASEREEYGGNLQEIQHDSEDYPLIGDCYADDYAQFVKDNKSIRRRYINVQRGVGFVRIGGIYVSFIENNVTIDGNSIYFDLRRTQALRILVLWYPKLVPYEQIYYNLSFGVNENYACSDESLGAQKNYLYVLMYHVQSKLISVTDKICISSFRKKGYKLVCHSKRQACPNESSVQDILHSQFTGFSS